MNLTDYLRASPRGTRIVIAKAANVSPAYINHVCSGFRRPSPQTCIAIEKATQGVVTRYELRPDDWCCIWPELDSPAADIEELTGHDTDDRCAQPRTGPDRRHPEPEKAA